MTFRIMEYYKFQLLLHLNTWLMLNILKALTISLRNYMANGGI